jgi:hypothetical protein
MIMVVITTYSIFDLGSEVVMNFVSVCSRTHFCTSVSSDDNNSNSNTNPFPLRLLSSLVLDVRLSEGKH